MSVKIVSIENMLQEAENNYVSSRFEDAAGIFQNIIQTMEQNKQYYDAIYFQYTRIVSLDRAELIESKIIGLMKLAEYCLKVALRELLSAIQQGDVEDRSKYMNYTQKILKQLNMKEERQSTVLSLISLYRDIINNDSKLELKIELQSRIITFHEELEMIAKPEINKLIELLISYGTSLLKSNRYHVEVIAAQQFVNAANWCKTLGELDRMRELLLRSYEITSYAPFTKYGFPSFNNIDEIKDYPAYQPN